MKLDSLVPLAHVADVGRSVEFYAKLGFTVMNSFQAGRAAALGVVQAGGANLMLGVAGMGEKLVRGEFRVSDRDGYVVMITHSD